MKQLTPALLAHLQGEVTAIRTCWKVTLENGRVHGFTDHCSDLDMDGVRYLAASGHAPSAIVSNSTLAVDNLDVAGVLDSDVITEADLQAGLWDHARVDIFQVNVTDLSQGVIRQHAGRLGEVRSSGHRFTAELRGLAQQLQQTLGELYSPTCRATLGDARCKVDLAPLRVTGTVATVVDARSFIDSARIEPEGSFDAGQLNWLSGDNTGLAMEVKTYASGRFVLQLAMPYAIAAGDSYSVTPGCRRRFEEDCKAKFNNVINFRGEPHLPGTDRMLKAGGA